MKKIALLLFSLAFVSGLFAQDPKSYPLINIIGTDSTYFISPFRTSGPVQVAFDFTGFSTDQVVIEGVYYVFTGKIGGVEVKRLVPIDGATFPLTLVKAEHQVVANGVTYNLYSFKLAFGFMGDQLAFKVTPANANSSDILKVWYRK